MNSLRLIGLAMLVGAGTAMAAIDPGLLNLVMPDATALSGAQVDQSLSSPFGQYILSKMQPGEFQKLTAATGFDPTRDLQQILAATSAGPNGGENALILGRGSFQPAQIASAATTAGATITSYRGVNLIGSAKNADGPVVAFLNTTTVAMGNTALVEAAIDRNVSGAVFSGALAQAAQAASAANSAWFATVTPLSQFLSGKTANPQLNNLAQNNLFQAVTGASGGVSFNSNNVTITADAVTTSAQNAQALVDVLKFLTSMIQTNTANQPAGQPVATLASAATFTTNGTTTHISLALSEQQAEQLFTQTATAAAAQVRKARTPAQQ